jgi:MFS family permease
MQPLPTAAQDTGATLSRSRLFLKLLLATAINSFAFFLDFVAIQTLIIFQWDKGPLLAATVATLYSLPLLLISPWAGAVADRFRQDRILVVTSLALFVLSFLQFFVSSAIPLLVIVVVKNCIRMFFSPAFMSSLRHDLPNELMPRGLAVVSTVQESAKVLGPAFSGLLLLVLEPIKTYLVIAGLYFLALLAVISLPRGHFRSSLETSPLDLWKDLVSGARQILGRKTLRAAALTTGIFAFAIFFSDNLLTVFSHEYGLTTSQYAYFCSAVGIGGISAALMAARTSQRMNALNWLKLAICVDSLVYSSMGVLTVVSMDDSTRYFLFLGLGLLRGIAATLQATSLSIYMQSKVGPELAGRAMSFHTLLYGLGMLTAPLTGYSVFIATSFAFVFGVTGVLMLLSLAPLALLSKMHRT